MRNRHAGLGRIIDKRCGSSNELPGISLVDQSRKTGALEVIGIEDVGKRREKNQGNFRKLLSQDAACGKAIHERHGEIEHDEVGLKLSGLGDRVEAIRSFGANDPSRKLKHSPQAFPHHRIIVGKEDTLHISQIS